jgi:HEAT repeat protein
VLRDADSAVREATAEVLKTCGSRAALPALLQALRDPASGVRWRAAQALDALKWQPENAADEAWRWTALGEFEKAALQGAAGIDALALATRDGVYYKRQAAIAALSLIGDARVVKPVLATLKDEDKNVRATAIDALARIGDHAAVAPLIAILGDSDPHVRSAAVGALSKLGDPRAIGPLAGRLRDDHWEVREAAIRALGLFKDNSAVGPLVGALKDRDREVREAAVRALMEIGDPAAVEALVVTLKDEQDSVRALATTALRRLDRNWEKSAAAKRAIPELRAGLKHREYWVRQAAADALAKIGEMRQVEPSLAHLLDPGKIRRQNATEILLRLLADFDSDLRQAAAEALGRLGDQQAVPPLVGALRDGNRWVSRSAARALRALQWTPRTNEE